MDSHSGVITHLGSDILECEVKWALGSITAKLVEVMEFQLSYFKSQKMMLLKCCTQYVSEFGKLSKWQQDWKRSVFITNPKKEDAKECSDYYTVVLILHANKVMLKILQARF